MDQADIGMQMLSNIPQTLDAIRKSNDYGAEMVKTYPGRFGLLVAVPTDDGEAGLQEAIRGLDDLRADGVAVTACYKGHWLSDPILEGLWIEMDKRGETVHIHPNAYADSHLGRPAPLIEVAFESARGVVEMLYSGMLEKYPRIRFIMSVLSLQHGVGSEHADIEQRSLWRCFSSIDGPSYPSRLRNMGPSSFFPFPRNNPTITFAIIRGLRCYSYTSRFSSCRNYSWSRPYSLRK